MTDKVQKIREEVERLMKELIQEKEKGFGSDVDDACILELQNVLTFIDSLQEEPASEDLEEAAFDYAESCKYDGGEKLLCVEHFKAGAKWGKNQAMAEIQAQSMALAHGCPKERVSEDLEEACQQLAENARKHKAETSSPFFSQTDYKQGVIDGAEWQKQQAISKACKWIDKNAARYLVDRFVGSMRITGIDISITEDFRKDM